MKKFYFAALLLLSSFAFSLSPLSAQTYVWKDGHPLVADPDSITFTEPDFGAQVIKTENRKGMLGSYNAVIFHYLTADYSGKPIWMSAELSLTDEQIASKHIGKMALYNRYTIARSDECPSIAAGDLQGVALACTYAVVSADHEGFGLTGDRVQAYCYGEANARSSIDALLAAREWLQKEGYTLSDTIVNFGYSQGGQTTVAAVKLAQTEYKNKVKFLKSIAGAGPYNLALTYKKFMEWGRIAQPVVLPMNIITSNELEGLGLDYKTIFLEPLASNVRSWVISKKFNTDELTSLIGSDSLKYFMQPAYMDTTSTEVKSMLYYAEQNSLTQGWTPDPETDLLLVHSLNDDIVAPENTAAMYQFFQDNGATKVQMDTTSLTASHLDSGSGFGIYMMMELTKLK